MKYFESIILLKKNTNSEIHTGIYFLELSSLMAVSYTHLDVYKRQVQSILPADIADEGSAITSLEAVVRHPSRTGQIPGYLGNPGQLYLGLLIST